MSLDLIARPIAPVRSGHDRDDRPFRFLNGEFHVKVSAADSAGQLCVIDTIRSEPGGPPMHVHHEQDEWFYVTEGTFDIVVGEIRHRLGPGDSIFGPRGVPHAFRNESPTGRILVLFQPAGSMEAFFHEGSQQSPLTPQRFAELSAEHGMLVVGPPLSPA